MGNFNVQNAQSAHNTEKYIKYTKYSDVWNFRYNWKTWICANFVINIEILNEKLNWNVIRNLNPAMFNLSRVSLDMTKQGVVVVQLT